MNITKFSIIAMVVSSLILVATVSVEAADKIITDPIGDVARIDIYSDNTTSITQHPDISVANIDITQITYTKNGGTVSLTLQVNGIIEDRGNTTELLGYDNANVIGYTLSLITSEEVYDITYVNKSCQLMYSDGSIVNLTESDFSAIENTLTVTFSLKNPDEIYDNLSSQVMFLKITLPEIFDPDTFDEEDFSNFYVTLLDIAPNTPLSTDVLTTYVSNVGSVGEAIQFNGSVSPLSGQPPYEYQWDFGDRSAFSQETSPTHTYTTTGEYTYNFTVTDYSGSSASATGTITITKEGGEGSLSTQMILFLAVLIIIIIIGIVVIVWIIRR